MLLQEWARVLPICIEVILNTVVFLSGFRVFILLQFFINGATCKGKIFIG
jgi:hypothetical protein